MTVSVKELRGSTPTLAEKLKESGVGNNEQLLAAAATPAQRKVLAASCGCDARVILELAKDLRRDVDGLRRTACPWISSRSRIPCCRTPRFSHHHTSKSLFLISAESLDRI